MVGGVVADGTKTKIKLAASVDFSAAADNLKKGTAVYFAPGETATEFYNVLVDEATCVGKMLDDTTENPTAARRPTGAPSRPRSS